MMKLKQYFELETAAAFFTWLTISVVSLWTWFKQYGVDDNFIIALGLFVVFWMGFSAISVEKGSREAFGSREYLLLALMYSAICGLYFTLPIHIISILCVIWAALLSYLRSRFFAYLLIPLGMIPFYISRSFYWQIEHFYTMMLLNTLFQFFSLIIFERMRFAEQAEAETKQLNRELQATQALVKAMGQQSERLRISRDLHDTLGHHLTALTLNLQVASHLAEGEVKEKIEQSFALSKLLLTEVRETVSHLREDAHIQLKDVIEKLVSGIQSPSIELVMDDSVEVVDAQVAETLFRCVQESLTNILKHSNATHCQIILTETPQYWLLRVHDNGRLSSETIVSGNGLTGMKERVQAVCGEMSWDISETGFVINVAIQKENS